MFEVNILRNDRNAIKCHSFYSKMEATVPCQYLSNNFFNDLFPSIKTKFSDTDTMTNKNSKVYICPVFVGRKKKI